jgi:HK97 family phage portal protein
VFKEQLQGHALGWGNGRAAIIRQGLTPIELIPLMPDRTDTVMVDGEKFHVTNPCEDDALRFRRVMEEMLDGNYVLPRDYIVLHDRDVLHIPGFGWDGLKGKNIADVAKDALGIDLRAQRYSNNGMRKGFAGRLMLEDAGNVFRNEDEARKFLDSFRDRHENSKSGETVGMLRQGMKATVLNMSNEDAQFIEQRKFSRQDVMLLFKLQHIPGDNSSVSYNSLEQKQLAYLASCLDYWLVRWEMQCDCKLRTPSEKRLGRVYHKFNRRTWLATDTKTTQDVLSGYIQSLVMSPNEAREVIDLNPYEGGDQYQNPSTTPSAGAAEPDEPEADEEMSELAEARMSYLTHLEGQRVLEGTSRKDFVGFLDNFYSKWPLTLINNLQSAGVSLETIQTQVNDHKQALLEASGQAMNADELRMQVAEVVGQWQ